MPQTPRPASPIHTDGSRFALDLDGKSGEQNGHPRHVAVVFARLVGAAENARRPAGPDRSLARSTAARTAAAARSSGLMLGQRATGTADGSADGGNDQSVSHSDAPIVCNKGRLLIDSHFHEEPAARSLERELFLALCSADDRCAQLLTIASAFLITVSAVAHVATIIHARQTAPAADALTPAWTLEGPYSDVAADEESNAIYALGEGGRVVDLDASGRIQRELRLSDNDGDELRLGRLPELALLTFSLWTTDLRAYES